MHPCLPRWPRPPIRRRWPRSKRRWPGSHGCAACGAAAAQSTGPGGEAKLIQTERIGPALDGTILVIEGKGYMPDGKAGFHAFAVVSYEVATGSYWLTSNAQGRSGRFRLTPTDTGYAWEIPQGPGVVRYVATLADGTWTETGDFAMHGQPARRFFQMTLKRIGDTDWPEAGGVPPR